ncbi:MurR/RpiR family transcriptional regulator [Pigmentiphaga aceris]|uniref:MurR/RpiR family transcriptional regulator n=1 Tax=Pigmentiphaga aceris TaxID=1940612 RepID=A0A5C0AW75_9BURK|nr:MurR/RpiR family transcriptional regulator [Pigmentiphaga aceris]QEI06639.1 MurR/RpiR family transcriptional regulator [Pigmentiphaga aceris]
MNARAQMLAQFDSLSPKLQVAARFAVDHPNEVVIASMRALAERAGAQPATLVRLAQQLGYAGWPELKSAFADDLGLNGERYGERARNLAARSQSTDLLGEMFIAQQRNLASTEALCTGALRDAARLLAGARAVHVAGFRASFPIAYSLVYGYRLFRNSVHLIDGQGGLEMQMRPIEQGDVVVAISFAPYSSECMDVIKAARNAGASILAMTDSNASPLALAANATLLFSIDSPSFFPSVAAAVAVTEALLELLVANGGDQVAARIGNAEKRLLESGAYLPPSAKRRSHKD